MPAVDNQANKKHLQRSYFEGVPRIFFSEQTVTEKAKSKVQTALRRIKASTFRNKKKQSFSHLFTRRNPSSGLFS
jgi:hypothetical protein